MANSNDTLYPENGQLALTNLLDLLHLYHADIPSYLLVKAKEHFKELEQAIHWGMGAIAILCTGWLSVKITKKRY